MNVDLTNTFKDARRLINAWKERYSEEEYPYKVILNIFYRKYTIEKMWAIVLKQSHPSFQKAYEYNLEKYAEVARTEIAPVLEKWIHDNRQVGMIKYSDFQSYIQSASQGNREALKGIEYTYFLHRILDELIILWISMVNSGESQVNAIAKLTRAVVEINTITNYTQIESIFDQLGAEKYLQTLLIKELNNQL